MGPNQTIKRGQFKVAKSSEEGHGRGDPFELLGASESAGTFQGLAGRLQPGNREEGAWRIRQSRLRQWVTTRTGWSGPEVVCWHGETNVSPGVSTWSSRRSVDVIRLVTLPSDGALRNYSCRSRGIGAPDGRSTASRRLASCHESLSFGPKPFRSGPQSLLLAPALLSQAELTNLASFRNGHWWVQNPSAVFWHALQGQGARGTPCAAHRQTSEYESLPFFNSGRNVFKQASRVGLEQSFK